MRWTYSRWDGTQTLASVDPDELMDALSDDLLADGDVRTALQRVIRQGLQIDGESGGLGIQTLLQSLRDLRQAELERYNLDSILQDICDRVADVVETERSGIESRMTDAAGDASLAEMLQSIVERKQVSLQELSDDPGSAVSQLAEYEFLDATAREKFRALTEMLERQVLQRHFQSMQQLLGDLSGESLEDVKTMLHDLNEVLQAHTAGAQSNRCQADAAFEEFMQRHGDHFHGASSVEELIGLMRRQASYTEALMASMSAEMREKLDGMMAQVLRDHTLRDQLARVYESLDAIAPRKPTPTDYPFSGDSSLTLEEALLLMRRMHDLDRLERGMRKSQETGDMSSVERDLVRHVMGEVAAAAIQQLQELGETLENAGYVERTGDELTLTTRGIRRIGQKALHEIFSHLRRDASGDHQTPRRGYGGDRAEETKLYQFGDAFILDIQATLMNSVVRSGAGSPLRLDVEDFEVYAAEQLTQAATVLMLDMSRSMPLRGCFAAAKKVVLALSTLIRLQFPRDHLYVVGFSDYARQIRPESLPAVSWGDYVHGTNMQHGLMLARKLLGRHAHGVKQVILITDGEPTAHFEDGRVHFAYPPTFRTFQETLREVKRCTHEGIVINTFMLERSHYLADFVTQMTRINRGRAFFATPEHLGDYILVDYVNSRQRLTSTR